MGNKPGILLLKLYLIVLFVCCSSAVSDELAFQFVAGSQGALSQPHDIVLSPDGKQLYVADTGNDRVAVLDAQTLKQGSAFGEGRLSEPHDVVFDTKGRLLVADTGHSRIAVYERAGDAWQLTTELSDRIRRPEGVAVHTDGRIFATGSASNNLVIYRNGRVIAEKDGFSSPHDVEFDRNGLIWIADANNNRMIGLDERLEVSQVLAGPAYDFSGPRYLDIDDANRIYVADKYSNSIKVIAPGGRILTVIGREKSGKGPGLFNRPEGVEIRGNDVWFSDTYNDRIVRYRVSRKSR